MVRLPFGIKAYPEKIDVFYNGALIATHERNFGQHQKCYRLEHYLPLLEIRSRAIFNAAPVRQNIPPEVLSKWNEEGTDHKTIIAYMKERFEEAPPIINDPVRIQAVDLRQYQEYD